MANSWFPHDSSASTDQKILLLRAEFGNLGYAWYFLILEWLWQSADGKAPLNIDSIAYFLHEDRTIIDRYIMRCIELEIFMEEEGMLYSFRLLREKELYLEKSKNAKRAVAIREAKKKAIDSNKKKKPGIDRSSTDVASDHPVPDQTRPTRPTERMRADNEVLQEFEKFVQWLNTTKLFPNPKVITDAARLKWAARRKRYGARELSEAFQNLTREPDGWQIANNGHRPLAWWLHSDERIENMKGCHLKKRSNSKFAGISLIST